MIKNVKKKGLYNSASNVLKKITDRIEMKKNLSLFFAVVFSFFYYHGKRSAKNGQVLLNKVIEFYKKKSEHKDRLFFHDLINQTHNISLFLENRSESKKEILNSDILMLRKEVLIIQTLIEDHFGYKHKNSLPASEYIGFDLMKKHIVNLCENYFRPLQIDFEIKFDEEFAKTDEEKSCKIHQSSFIRILTNLVKNIAEVKSSHVMLHFLQSNRGIDFSIKNKILHLKNQEMGAKQTLPLLILENGMDNTDRTKRQVQGVGIESVIYLCTNLGGKYQFMLEGDYWISNIFLPSEDALDLQEKIAA